VSKGSQLYREDGMGDVTWKAGSQKSVTQRSTRSPYSGPPSVSGRSTHLPHARPLHPRSTASTVLKQQVNVHPALSNRGTAAERVTLRLIMVVNHLLVPVIILSGSPSRADPWGWFVEVRDWLRRFYGKLGVPNATGRSGRQVARFFALWIPLNFKKLYNQLTI
jgi:hypothetical protein